ncbi:hypothetical protein QR680_011268 [Steinernema hermaphroditum]|uniref:Uncharacterized protein n=1 Tax=Steinernema hermaphroditum TaxID=289476 RepID=A0AA39IUH0_9BILA|nr:hypothetical protein QR680_011268 [Steinernema hermaphroditum]
MFTQLSLPYSRSSEAASNENPLCRSEVSSVHLYNRKQESEETSLRHCADQLTILHKWKNVANSLWKIGSFTPLPATSLLSRSHPALLEHVEAWKLHIVIDSLGTDVDKPEGRGDPVRSSAHSPDEREQEDTVMLEYLQRPQGPDETTDQAEELLAQLIEIRRKLRSTGARSTYCIASEICRPTSTIPAIAPEALVIASKAIATAPAS